MNAHSTRLTVAILYCILGLALLVPIVVLAFAVIALH